jgi:hypothetical protein
MWEYHNSIEEGTKVRHLGELTTLVGVQTEQVRQIFMSIISQRMLW